MKTNLDKVGLSDDFIHTQSSLNALSNDIIKKLNLTNDDKKKLIDLFHLYQNILFQKSNKIKNSYFTYKQLYDSSPLLLRTITDEGIIVDCNKTYHQRLGFSKSEVIDSSIFDHIAKKSYNDLKTTFMNWKRTGTINNQSLWFKTKFGTEFPVVLNVNTFYDEYNRKYSNSVIIDETNYYKVRNAEKKLLKKNIELKQLKKVNKIRKELLSIVKHELKTPLVPIQGNCELLLEYLPKNNLTNEQLESLHGIKDNVIRLERTLNLIFLIHGLETNNLLFNFAPLSVNDFLFAFYSKYKNQMKNLNIDFTLSYVPHMHVKVDEKMLFTVLQNLVQNSMSFVPEKEGKIEIGATKKDGSACFYVKDNGSGIPKDKQKKIFEKFYQIDTTPTRKHQGIGLGLTVSKSIIKKMNGKISLKSKKREGTTVSFFFPLNEIETK